MIRGCLLLLMLVAATAVAELLPLLPSHPVVEAILFRAGDPAELRARLVAFATTDTSREATGEAWYWTGASYAHEGAVDSAIAALERAVVLRGAAPERDALSEALFARGRPADLTHARDILARRLDQARLTSELEVASTRGRLAWSYFLGGQADTASKLFAKEERRLLDDFEPMRREWRYRIAATELGRGNARKAFDLLTPLAIDSRLQDRDVMEMIREAVSTMGGAPNQAVPALQRQLALDDRDEAAFLEALPGRRVAFGGEDGFPLSAVVTAPAGRKARRAAVALVAPGQSVTDYDSLATGLRRAGWAVLIVEPRGTGRSVAATAPLPDSWRTREAQMMSLSARDALRALGALARATPVDTTSYLLIGHGAAAAIAAEAAESDPRVSALVLIAPNPSPVERGLMRARLTALRRPVYFLVPGEDFLTVPLADTLYHSVDQRASRFSDSERIGRGPRVFRNDPGALPRLTRWLDETWAARRGSRPAAPRRG